MFPTRYFNLRAFARRFFPRPSSGPVYRLPDDIIVATQTVVAPRYRQSFDGATFTQTVDAPRYRQTHEDRR